MNKIEDILGKIGLTKQESRVYLGLLELQEAKTGKLCKHTKIASSNIYKILDFLMKKGLVSYRIQNNIKIFMPSSPEVLNDLFLEKQNKLDEERKEVNDLISSLKVKKPKKEPYSNYKYFEGLTGIKSMWHEINYSMNKDDIMRVYTGKRKSYETMVGFLNEHHNLRVKKKVKALMIFPKEDIELANKRKKQDAKVQFMNLKNDAEWGVWKDIFYLYHFPKKSPRGFLIKDEVFASTFKQVFDQLWKEAKLKGKNARF